MEYFFAKAAKESTNVTPASPVNTRTAERTFARSNLFAAFALENWTKPEEPFIFSAR